jgi:hypothetical protein
MMKKSFLLGSVLSFALVSVASAQSAVASTGDGEQYTHSQLKQLVREARTRDQFEALASYYAQQQQIYRQQAKAVFHEWISQWQMSGSHFNKYPTPADSARNRYEDYVAKASEAGELFAKYSELAEPTPPSTQQQM